MMDSLVSPADCLPSHLRGATITKIAAGLSGAGVYRVDAGNESFVLKIADEPLTDWRRRLHIQQMVADADVAPRVIHTDEERRAVLTEFVVDRSFAAYFMNPQTRAVVVAHLGRTLRRVHDLPLPADVRVTPPRESLATVWAQLSGLPVPAFVADTVRRVLDAPEPPREPALVLSHNDVNPSNIVYDGTRIVLLDWQVAGPNDPLYDLATVAMFTRMDHATCLQLIGAYHDAPVSEVPTRFVYLRRLTAALCGAFGLSIALQNGYVGSGGETASSTPRLGDVYQRMRAGTLNIATPDGGWDFALALIRESGEF